MNKLISKNLFWIIFSSLLFVLLLARLTFGWTSPTANPPRGGGALYYYNGNVGIGTTGPISSLQVSGSWATGPAQLTVTNPTDYISGIGFTRSGSADKWMLYRYGSGGSDRFCMGINGVNEPFCISSTGYVGIGTTAPARKLEVTALNFDIARFTGSNAILDITNTASDGIRLSTDGTGYFGVRTTGSSGDDNFFINTSGNVGIGTTNPGTYRLEVVGGATEVQTLCINNDCKSSWPAASNYYLTATCRDVSCASKCSQSGRSCSAALYTYNNGSSPPINVDCTQTYAYDCANYFTCLCN